MRYAIALTMVGLVSFGCGPTVTDGEPAGVAGEPAVGFELEHGEHEDGHVELDPEQVEAAGIRTTVAGPGRIETTLELSAVVGVNVDSQAHVTPRAGGLVSAIHAHLGRTVRVGDPLCEIDSVDLGRAVGAYLASRATVDASVDILARERELLSKNVALAQEVFDREQHLAEREITTLTARYEAERALQEAQLRQDSRILELEARWARERIELVAAERELEILGLEHDDVEEIAAKANAPHEPFGTYLIRAPRDGVIVARDVTENEFVDAETRLFEIQDLTRVWVLASVYEQDLASVRLGAPVHVRLDAFPSTGFEGEVSFIDYHVEPGTRATSVRIELENEPIEAWPETFPIRPGMFGRVEVITGSREVGVVVPESALVHEPEGDVVFVEHEPGVFQRRAVRVGSGAGDNVELVEGLEPGERVAVSGTFVLKSAARAGELGEGHGH